MAKGPLFIAPISGKVGNVVAYTLKNSNNKETQAVRAYVSDVTNPRTEPQAIQRLKLAPALNFYRLLGQILDNAWQGQRYGNLSRQYFMSQAMTQSTGIPFIVKGDKRFYPGEYPVAQGSLVRQSVTAIADNLLTTSLVSPGVSGTWGEFSQGLINKNFGIKDGDKLTFIFCGTTALGEYLPAYSYVILDTSNTTAAADILASSNLSFAGNSDAQLQVGVVNAVSDIVAGAVILSRLDTSAGVKWLRSNSVMFCSDDYKELMMGTTAYQAAIISYMNSDNVSSDWYLNAGINGGYHWVGPGGNSGSNLHVVSVANISVPRQGENAVYVAVATMSDGTKRAYRSNTSPSRVMQLNGGDLVSFSWSATDSNLAVIQAADAEVTGWIVGNETSGGTVVENP
jgi:hypothetical protein